MFGSEFSEDRSHLVFLPLSQGILWVLSKSRSILSLFTRHRQRLAFIGALLEVGLCSVKFSLLCSCLGSSDFGNCMVQVTLSSAKALHSTLCSSLRLSSFNRGSLLSSLLGFFCGQDVCFSSLYLCDFVSIEDFDLGHCLNDFQAVVRLLGQRISEEI